jgi:hypothetical protein
MLKDFSKSKEWQEAKELLLDCVNDEKKDIVLRNVDDKLVGQEYRAITTAKRMVKRFIRKVEGTLDFKEKPKRLI